MEDIPLSAQFGALIVLLLLSAFFSLAETSMMALNRYRLKHLVKQGHRGARLAYALLARTDQLLGVILLGNTLVAAGAATLAAIIAHLLLGEYKWVPGVSAVAITLALLIFSEITPKVIGAAYAERIAFAVSYVLTPMLKLLYPFVWFVNLFVSALLALMGFKPPATSEPQRLTAEELRSLVLEAGQYIPKKHRSILVNLFDLERVTVEDVMTPRAHIEAVDLEAPAELIAEQLATSYHTRLLVYRSELGNIAGILHLRKVLALMREGELDRDKLAELLTEPYFIPASTPLFAQLQYFQENRQRLALVVDEYGELQGLMTLEDIVEEIIGEFTTNAPSVATIRAWDKNESALVEGTSPLRELNRKLGLTLPLAGPKTLNGLIIEHFQDIPEAGVSLKIAGVPMEIVQTQDRVVRIVRLFKPKSETLSATERS
jgi:magnesium and cobalt exporter, CNNM family